MQQAVIGKEKLAQLIRRPVMPPLRIIRMLKAHESGKFQRRRGWTPSGRRIHAGYWVKHLSEEINSGYELCSVFTTFATVSIMQHTWQRSVNGVRAYKSGSKSYVLNRFGSLKMCRVRGVRMYSLVSLQSRDVLACRALMEHLSSLVTSISQGSKLLNTPASCMYACILHA